MDAATRRNARSDERIIVLSRRLDNAIAAHRKIGRTARVSRILPLTPLSRR